MIVCYGAIMELGSEVHVDAFFAEITIEDGEEYEDILETDGVGAICDCEDYDEIGRMEKDVRARLKELESEGVNVDWERTCFNI